MNAHQLFMALSVLAGTLMSCQDQGDEVKAPTPAGVRRFTIVALVTIHDEA